MATVLIFNSCCFSFSLWIDYHSIRKMLHTTKGLIDLFRLDSSSDDNCNQMFVFIVFL